MSNNSFDGLAADGVAVVQIQAGDLIGLKIAETLKVLNTQERILARNISLLTTLIAQRYADQVPGAQNIAPPPVEVLDGVAGLVAEVINDAQRGETGPPTDGYFVLNNPDGTTEAVEYPLTWAGLENLLREQTEVQTLGFKPGPDGGWATYNAKLAEWIEARKANAAFAETFGAPVGNA